jgi:hypothetical protein
VKLALILILFTTQTFANDIEVLTDAISEFCDFNSYDSDEKKLTCGEKITNCIINVDGKWNDKLLFKCIKEYHLGESALDKPIRSVSEKKELQGQFRGIVPSP